MTVPDRVVTYQDLVEHLMRQVGAAVLSQEHFRMKAAVADAMEEVSLAAQWKYFRLVGRVILTEPQTLTVSSATTTAITTSESLPAWAVSGRVYFTLGGVEYDVDHVHAADKTLYLKHAMPSVPTGTFTLYQASYALPSDLGSRIYEVDDEDGWWGDCYIQPSSWVTFVRHYQTTRTTDGEYRWTIMGDPQQRGGLKFVVWGVPDRVRTFDFVYQRLHRQLRYAGVGAVDSGGTVTLTNSTSAPTAVAGSGTAFRSDMVGSVLRIGTAANHPTGNNGLNPYASQEYIDSVTSSTALALESTITSASGVKYTISDPIDLPPYLLPLLRRRCEVEYYRPEPKRFQEAMAAYKDALLDAMERDAMHPLPSDAGKWSHLPDRFWVTSFAE